MKIPAERRESTLRRLQAVRRKTGAHSAPRTSPPLAGFGGSLAPKPISGIHPHRRAATKRRDDYRHSNEWRTKPRVTG